VDDVVGRFHESTLDDYKQRLNVVSAVSGQIISTSNFRELICGAVSEALSEPLNWDLVTSSLAEELSGRNLTNCIIYQVSSRTGPLLSSALTKNTTLKVDILNVLEEDQVRDSPASNTGKFSQSSIAVIGYSGRFPESASNEEFWELLMAGRDVHREIPEDRFDWKVHYDPSGKTKNTSRIKYGCFIKEPGLFDARFFNMSPRECESCDPAQRLAITSAYEAIEMAGLVPNASPSTQQDRIGVFYGVTSDDWREVNSGQNVDTYFIPGGNRAFIPGRISYFFRFCGPSLSIDTACSSSFAAIQTACSYLWRGECDTALAGGANILTNPDNFAGLDRGHFLSTTGNCNAFDDGANGYCRSDAVGTVILKRLEDAMVDNDPIFGVIRGAYTNHCGRTISITRPFEGDQVAVFNRILRYAEVDPRDVGYVEMHGTGTQAGDATEMKSVLSVFAPETQRKLPLYLGTAKANIGHAESASGVASLIKVLMMMKNNAIPPHCGIKTKINHGYPRNMKERNIHIPMEPTAWNADDASQGKRKAFLNNFSAAGGNTAILLEDSPSRSRPSGANDPRSTQPVTVTAKTIKSLQGNIEALVSYLEQNPDLSLSSLSYTTTARRIHHNFRVIVSGSDIASIRTRLQGALSSNSDQKPVPSATNRPKVILVFTGQGTMYESVGKQLFETLPSFRESILRFNGIAGQQGFPSFLPLIDGSIEKVEEASPIMIHLALVCIQMALFGLWKSLGVSPAATIGHSLGEYPALYASGVLTAASVVYLVGTRARLLSEKATAGTHGMLAVKLPVSIIKPELSGTSCDVACLNQPSSNVISGPMEELVALGDKLKSRGAECILLEIPFAFHSAQVDPLLEAFEKAAGSVCYRPPSIPYISPLLGKVIPEGDTETLTALYLIKACRRPVNFQGAVDAAKSDGLISETSLWVEVGLHPACSGMIKGILGRESLTIASLRKNTDSWALLTSGLESLYANGIDIHWTEYHRGFEDYQKVLSLPRYSWDVKSYWILYRNNFCLTKGDDLLPAQPEMPVSRQNKPRYLSPSVQRILEQKDEPHISTILAESDIHDERLAPIFAGHSVNDALLCPSARIGFPLP
jgi:naphtho-gamma-pyrone polyketide synthase